MKPGIYPGVGMADYLAIKAVNASLLTALIFQCAEKAWFDSPWNPNPPPPDDTDASDAGQIGHALFLEGTDELVEVIDPAMYPTKSSGNIPTGYQNKEIKAARDNARANGRIPILKDKYAVVEQMVASARRKIDRVKARQPAVWQAFQTNGGESETTVVFEVDGVLCKMRPDRMNAQRTAMFDAKFSGVSAEPSSWGRTQLLRMGYYIGAAFYRLGLGGHDNISYTYLIVENEAPYLASLVGVTPQLFDIGAQQVQWALTRWKRCVATNTFPGYADDIEYPDTPPWLEADWIAKQAEQPFGPRKDDGVDYASQA